MVKLYLSILIVVLAIIFHLITGWIVVFFMAYILLLIIHSPKS